MASLFRDFSLGHSWRESTPPPSLTHCDPASPPCPTSPVTDLCCPIGELGTDLTDLDLRDTAYEILVYVSRTASGRPLRYHTSASNSDSSVHHHQVPDRSLTSSAASRMKKALGLNIPRRTLSVGELIRTQMRVSETVDLRIRKALLGISAGQVGRKIESVVLPLELLQQLKQSDFTDLQEYEACQKRLLKVLEEGLILHPRVPIDQKNLKSKRLKEVIEGLGGTFESGKKESMQVLRNASMEGTNVSAGSLPEFCHWADGFPLNLRLYEKLLEACFDISDQVSIIEEADELMEEIKKTWVILGINQTFHNLCRLWVLFRHFVSSGKSGLHLLKFSNNQLADVAEDAKRIKDPTYSKILNVILSSAMSWAEKRLLTYHDTFNSGNINTMCGIVSLGVTASRILIEDISSEYRRKKKSEGDVTRTRIDTYIRSSIRTAFAQRMEKADSSRRASRNQPNSIPILAILAKDVSELVALEMQMFSPVLKQWHPFAAGVAAATLHACYGNELKQFISNTTELSADVVQVLRDADKLERDLVQIAVVDSADSDDGGKAVIRQMPPYEAEDAIAGLVKTWIKERVDRIWEMISSRCFQQEVGYARSNEEGYAPSAVEVVQMINEAISAYFQLSIPIHPALLPHLISGLDKSLQHYATKARSGCGTKNTYMPTTVPPLLTRNKHKSMMNVINKKLQNTKERSPPSHHQEWNQEVPPLKSREASLPTPELCVRIKTMHHIETELIAVEKRITTHLRNCESARAEDFSNGSASRFELAREACRESISQLSVAMAYGLVFADLNHLLWDSVCVSEPSSSGTDLFLRELKKKLVFISNAVHDPPAQAVVIRQVVRASFDRFLLVLLAGGSSRSFSGQDSETIKEDFHYLKNLFLSHGIGQAGNLIGQLSKPVDDVLPLFETDTESLIAKLKPAVASGNWHPLPLHQTVLDWGSNKPDTILRCLCYRKEKADGVDGPSRWQFRFNRGWTQTCHRLLLQLVQKDAGLGDV